jgi:hypothetical protein
MCDMTHSHRFVRPARTPREITDDPGDEPVVGDPFGGDPAEDQLHDRPVFLDRSGHRRRVIAVAGGAAAVVLVIALVLFAAGLSGVSPLRVPGFPDPARQGSQPTVAPSAPAPENGGQARPAVATVTPDPTTSGNGQPRTSSPRHIPTQTPSHSPKPTK